MIVTVDGPAGAGKGTIANHLADVFNLKHLDTGLLFRAAAKRIIDKNIDLSDEAAIIDVAQSITVEDTKQEGLRHEDVASVASKIAAIPGVREPLKAIQRLFTQEKHDPYAGVILDGRDIGTVICPNAPCKLFVTASPEVRAARRLQEIEADGCHQTMMAKISKRDVRDSTRTAAPLAAAADAFVIDTSNLTIEQACTMAEEYVRNNCLKKQVA